MKKGLYEKVIDNSLAQELTELATRVQSEALDSADSHTILAEHLGDLIASVLRRLPSQHRLENQRLLANEIIELLAEKDKSLRGGAALPDKLERLLRMEIALSFVLIRLYQRPVFSRGPGSTLVSCHRLNRS